MTYIFRLFDFWNFFFGLSFFSFSFLFAGVIGLLLGLLGVKKLLGKCHRDRQLLPWSSQVWWRQILVWVFCSTFWAFLCISQAPFRRSLWSGYHWKYLFLLQKLSIDDANFGQKWWRQKWRKGQGPSRPVTASMGVNGFKSFFPLISWSAD